MADSFEKRQRERKKREKKQMKQRKRRERGFDKAEAGPAPEPSLEDAPSRFDLLPEYSASDAPTDVEGKWKHVKTSERFDAGE